MKQGSVTTPFERRPSRALVCMKLGLCAATLHVAPGARAADDEASQGFAKSLTGDWGGERTRLVDRGIGLSLGYVCEAATNTQGGPEKKARYTDQWSFGSKLDLQKLLGWHHAAAEVVITDRNGRNLGDDASLNTLQGVQEVYGRGQTWRLTRLSLRQTWLDGGLDLKLGRLPVGDDFAAFPCDFQNLTFCGSQPGNVRGVLWYSYPVSQWGTRVKVALGGEMSAQLGVYQVNPRYIDDSFAHHQGLYPNNPSGTTGALIPIEFGWTPTLGGLPGNYKVGAWYDTSNANNVTLDTSHQPLALTGGTPLQRNSRSGAHLNFAQQITGRDKGSDASVFLNITQSDRATAASMDRQIALGVTWKGPFDGRPADTIGFALGSNHGNGRVADNVRLSNARNANTRKVPGSETVGELFYAWVHRPFFSLQPNVQYVHHPGGVNSNDAVMAIGLRSSVDF